MNNNPPVQLELTDLAGRSILTGVAQRTEPKIKVFYYLYREVETENDYIVSRTTPKLGGPVKTFVLNEMGDWVNEDKAGPYYGDVQLFDCDYEEMIQELNNYIDLNPPVKIGAIEHEY